MESWFLRLRDMDKTRLYDSIGRLSVFWFIGGAATAAIMFSVIIVRLNAIYF